jgi:hypothetical protein
MDEIQPRFLATLFTCCKSDAPCRYTSLSRTLSREASIVLLFLQKAQRLVQDEATKCVLKSKVDYQLSRVRPTQGMQRDILSQQQNAG